MKQANGAQEVSDDPREDRLARLDDGAGFVSP
jgi:hypothetical protein